jgi:hypothetical protein
MRTSHAPDRCGVAAARLMSQDTLGAVYARSDFRASGALGTA